MKKLFTISRESIKGQVGVYILSAAAILLTVSQAMPVELKGTAPQQLSAPAPPAPAAPTTIPVVEIVGRASDVSNYLDSLNEKFARGSAVGTIGKLLPAAMSRIYAELAHTEMLIRQHPTLMILQSKQERWKQLYSESKGWLEALTKRSNELQKELKALDVVRTRWELTLSSARTAQAPDSIVEQAEKTLAAIIAAESPLREQLASLLQLQGRLATAVTRCEITLTQLDEAQKQAMSGILVRDSAQLIDIKLWADVLAALPGRTAEMAGEYSNKIYEYSDEPIRYKTLHAGLLLLLTLLFVAARRRSRQWLRSQRTDSHAVEIFEHPYAAALLVTILFITSQYSAVNGEVKQLAQVVVLLPMVILIRPLLDKRIVSVVYVLGLLFVFDALDEIFAPDPLVGQAVFVIAVLASVAVVIWFWLHLWKAAKNGSRIPHRRYFRLAAGIGLSILICGLIAAIFGYMRLARLLVSGVLGGAVLALSMYTTFLVMNGSVVLLLRIRPLSKLRAVAHNRAKLEKRIYRILLLLTVLAWGVRYLNYLGLLGMAQSFGHAVLDAKFERGDFSISTSNLLEFFITVWLAYLLSGLIRSVLREDVYSRLGVKKGKSYAYLNLLHYFIITLGFLAAIAALGVNLTRLTVLTGALGVGIGFGLQSVVNNFVSGLILLFERPIHVGDTVEVGELLGDIRSIGIRASTVHTRQGADIIVPNSQLVTEKVTNWTLSDRLRRIELPLGLSYGSAPNEVIKVLEKTAAAHKSILEDPAPQALFSGYGDSSINFELRVWTDQFDDWAKIRSELAVAVYEAVIAAGMTFPFPQRVVRLLKDDEGGGPSEARQ